MGHFTKRSTTFDRHIKSFLNLQRVSQKQIERVNPHVYFLTDMTRSIACDYQPLHQKNPYFYPNHKSIDSVSAFIAHYQNQSYDRFLARRMNRPRDDTGTFRKKLSKKQIHKMNNDIECLLVANKYNTRNMKWIQKYRVEEDHTY